MFAPPGTSANHRVPPGKAGGVCGGAVSGELTPGITPPPPAIATPPEGASVPPPPGGKHSAATGQGTSTARRTGRIPERTGTGLEDDSMNFVDRFVESAFRTDSP